MSDIVWTAPPEVAERTVTKQFMARHGITSYADLVTRSIDDPDWFWRAVIDHLGIPFQTPITQISDRRRGPEWTTWFGDAAFNLAVACVDRWAAETPNALALVSEREDGRVIRYTFSELADSVGRHASVLQSAGAGRGDRVTVFLPMNSAAVISMLAIARIGAVFVPVFSGFGPEAIAARLSAAEPSVFVVGDGVQRRGRVVDMKSAADAALEMAGVDPAVLVVSCLPDRAADLPWTDGRDRWFDDLVPQADPVPAAMTRAEDPVLLTYTSGTTGKPKGIVHVHGGLAVKIIQEGAFQLDLHPGDVHMWVTDMGWVMGQWEVIAGLGNGATIVTYDGAPDHPGPGRVWEIVERHSITALGVSPTLIRALQPHGTEPVRRHDISSLKSFGSTGEPWNPDPWWWLFRDVGGERAPIVNLSGGTEIGACLLSVNLLQGLKPTSLGGPSLGVDVDVFDADGNPIRGGVGELVVKGPWPGMTRGFWRDDARYLETYWSRWPGVWVHGDWASIDDDGFWYLHGRSDETLNIAGKRLGPAEVESVLVADRRVVMAAAVGFPDRVKGEVVAAYVVLADPADTTDQTAAELSEAVANALGKPFRPKAVVFVDDLPRTRSAKIMRRVVRARALGRDPGDVSSLENPAAVDAIEPL